ncbi:alpha/beta hydrolase [Spongiibacter thalassae]|uniref:alpha/beta hydrolase n=1 Tax=Spongiibacter thalassae TaxID=2721624 RepID=UPI001B2FF4D5|nr:alpha/beta hydrolase [Spongiibacter thalassae]
MSRAQGQTVTETPPWWLTLPEDFYAQADGTELDGEYPLKVFGTAAADRALRTALAGMVAASLLPKLLRGNHMAEERQHLDFYAHLAQQRDTAKVFAKPKACRVSARQPTWREYRPSGLPAFQLSFDSPFEPLNPNIADSYLSHKRNRRAHAQYWTHPDGPRPTLIFVHGVVESWYALNSHYFSLRWFYDRGYDIAMITLPFHGSRANPCSMFSGQGMFSGGFAHLNESILHAISDLRVLVDYLFKRGAPHVGVSGLSLGGYISSLLAVVEPRLAFCIPNSPLVAPVDTMRGWQPTRSLMDKIEQRSGLSPQELRRGMAVHSPLSYQPVLDPERVLVIGGAGDRFTPPRYVRLLHAHWPESHLHWFPGNHMIHLGRRDYLKLMLSFMDSHCQNTAYGKVS